MRYAVKLFAISLASVFPTAMAADVRALGEAARSVDARAVESLGFGVHALTLLFHAAPGTFLLKDELVEDGRWEYVSDLERAGFARFDTHEFAEGEVVEMWLTAEGRAVRDGLMGR